MIKFEEVAHSYQKSICNQLIKNPNTGLFVDMGLGKTACVLFSFKWLKEKKKVSRMLIIAPKFVALHTWANEIKKWEDFSHLTINVAVGNENKRRDAFSEPSDIVIINRENVTWMVKNVSMKSFQVLVMDELSSFKNPISQRFKALSKIMYLFDYRWGLTGTPAPNGYLDLWSQMYLLDPNILGRNFWVFRNKYFYEAFPYKWVMIKNGEDLINEKLKANCISLLSSDWLNMPLKIENHIQVPMDLKGLKTYEKALKDLVYITDDQLVKLDGNLTIKLQQLASGFIYCQDNKNYDIVHETMLNKLEEIIDCTSGNTLLFYNFQAEKEIIKSKFSFARELKSLQDFEDWDNGNVELAIVHPVSVGYGLNLQSGGNNIIWYGYNWAADTVQQANARLYRQGQTQGVIINYLYVANTIHERIRAVLEGKINKQDLLLECVKYIENVLNLKDTK